MHFGNGSSPRDLESARNTSTRSVGVGTILQFVVISICCLTGSSVSRVVAVPLAGSALATGLAQPGSERTRLRASPQTGLMK